MSAAKTGSRTFTCGACGDSWSTTLKGNFRKCPPCKEADKQKSRTKRCLYTPCAVEFTDSSPKNGQRYCSEDCRYRAKQERAGRVAEGGFLKDRQVTCKICPVVFTPAIANQVYCSIACRDVDYAASKEKSRHKTCKRCGEPFYDDSLKGNRRSHSDCSRVAWGFKIHTDKEPQDSMRTEERRKWRNMTGQGGRYDQISTMTKYTHSWWGRVSELIYASYRPHAEDMNVLYGATAPYDYKDALFNRVDVRGTKARDSVHGRSMWTISTSGLGETCDHVFVVGYSQDRSTVEHLWMIPSSDIPPTSIRFSPTSGEYNWGAYDVSKLWGLNKAITVLKFVKSLPDPVRPGKRDWMNDPKHISGSAPTRRGRRAEILYGEMYPQSWDMNFAMGWGFPYDFEDIDGTRVDVKSSRRHLKTGRNTFLWSFSMRRPEDVQRAHQCDVYSCLALDESGERVLHEFRIPASVVGSRLILHIQDPPIQWAQYENRAKVTLDIRPDADQSEIDAAVDALLKMPFPAVEPPRAGIALAMFEHVRDFPVSLAEDVIGPWSPKGTRLCSAFFPNRYKARYNGGVTAYEAWQDRKHMLRAVRFQVHRGDLVTPHRVLRAITMQHRTPSVFKPTVAKWVYENLCPKGGTVWDPCSGYGGRLLGAFAAGVQYIATDVEPETVQGNLRLAEVLGYSARVVCERAEVFDPGPVDLVFTSPPYFDRELYSDRQEQSWVLHDGGFDSWVDGFLRPVIRMAHHRLPVGGHLVLNVADIRKGRQVIPLVERTVEEATALGFELNRRLWMPLARLNRSEEKAREPVLVFRKT
jgi:hypothetical protein